MIFTDMFVVQGTNNSEHHCTVFIHISNRNDVISFCLEHGALRAFTGHRGCPWWRHCRDCVHINNNVSYTFWTIAYSSAHPFSLSCRVDYCLNWPQPRLPPSPPLPSFHFSFADIYWSLSEKFPSSHPFPKVELPKRKKKEKKSRKCVYVIL